LRIVVADDGRGFDPLDALEMLGETRMDRSGGRGLFLIRTFMDSVTHNALGNEITMVKFIQVPAQNSTTGDWSDGDTAQMPIHDTKPSAVTVAP